MRNIHVPAWILITLIPAACTGTDADGGAGQSAADRPRAEQPPSPNAPSARPDTVHGTIQLEGMVDTMTYHLYESPAGFPVPFSTYVPRDMAAEPVRSDEGEALRFVAEFGGQRNEDVYVDVFFPPAGTGEAAAREQARALAESRGIRERDPELGRRFDWSIVEYDFRERQPDGDTIVGTVALGRRGDRFFTITFHYPEPYADGFGPRARHILDEWRWADGAPLGG